MFPQNPSPARNLNSKVNELKLKLIFPGSISTKLEISFSNDFQLALKTKGHIFKISDL